MSAVEVDGAAAELRLPAASAGSSPEADGIETEVPTFEPASTFAGARPGRVFKLGSEGLGYYQDHGETTCNGNDPRATAEIQDWWRYPPCVPTGLGIEAAALGEEWRCLVEEPEWDVFVRGTQSPFPHSLTKE